MTNATQLRCVAELFLDRIESRGPHPALHWVKDTQTVTRTWSELGQSVFRLAAALHQLGVRQGDRVAHWSENRAEWVFTDLALNCLGAVHVPIHSTLSARQAADQIIHSDSQVVIISGGEQWKQLAPLKAEFPLVEHWLSYDDAKTSDFTAQSVADLIAKADPDLGHQLAMETSASLDPNAMTTILYSSGTTGEPKGIMLSQRNLMFNAKKLADTFADEPEELRLNFLPLSHIFARTCDLYTWLFRGAELALTQNRDTIIDDCKRFQPIVMNGVPFFFERVRQKLEEKGIADQPGVLCKALGGKIRGCFSGGGALAEHTYDYYLAQDVPLMSGYGMTEASPVISFSTPDSHRRGCSGVTLEETEVSLADDGEILTRGPHVMLGYWKEPEATAEVIRDGWLHTGDLGAFEEGGQLRITGRKKEMIVTSTGKNIFPGHIEDLLCRDPLIIQALVIGDGRPCLSALIVPDPDVLKSELWKRKILVFSRKSAVKHRRVRKLYQERIEHQLADVAKHEQVKLFTIMDCGFTPESGHMTAKLSLRRDVIARDYAELISKMYAAGR